MDAVTKHRSHPEIVKRLRRAEGHLRSVIAMIEAERPCLEIAQQMHAVEKAIGQAKKALIENHPRWLPRRGRRADGCRPAPGDRSLQGDREVPLSRRAC